MPGVTPSTDLATRNLVLPPSSVLESYQILSSTWSFIGTFPDTVDPLILEYNYNMPGANLSSQNSLDFLLTNNTPIAFDVTVIINYHLSGFSTQTISLSAATYTQQYQTFSLTFSPTTRRIGISFQRTSGSASDVADLSMTMLQSLCFPGNTLISMENGSFKQIKDVQEGDLVICNNNNCNDAKVMVVIPSLAKNWKHLVRFPKDSISPGIPFEDLEVSPPHPIFFKDARRPADAFIGHNGIHYLPNLHEHLYTLQFQHDGSFYDGSFYANGLQVQSHSPYHFLCPLPRHLLSIEDQEREYIQTTDSLHHVLPLVHEKVCELV